KGVGADDFTAAGGDPSALPTVEIRRPRPRIRATDQDLARVTERAWDALVAANSPPSIFLHGVPVWVQSDQRGGPRLQPLDFHRMRYRLARVARWTTGSKKERDTLPPAAVCNDMLVHPNPPLPLLEMI